VSVLLIQSTWRYLTPPPPPGMSPASTTIVIVFAGWFHTGVHRVCTAGGEQCPPPAVR
jgi:hypothetical protein